MPYINIIYIIYLSYGETQISAVTWRELFINI